MNNNQKTYFQISSDASTDQVFKLLDALQSDKKDEIDELVNDFDTKCIAPEEIELTDNPGNVSALRLEVNTHVADQGTIHTKEIESNKKRKKSQKKVPRSHGNAMFLHILENIVFLRVELPTNLKKVQAVCNDAIYDTI